MVLVAVIDAQSKSPKDANAAKGVNKKNQPEQVSEM
jgi:hypothetical protein